MSERGYRVSKIQARLHVALEDIAVSKKSLCMLKKYHLTGLVADH